MVWTRARAVVVLHERSSLPERCTLAAGRSMIVRVADKAGRKTVCGHTSECSPPRFVGYLVKVMPVPLRRLYGASVSIRRFAGQCDGTCLLGLENYSRLISTSSFFECCCCRANTHCPQIVAPRWLLVEGVSARRRPSFAGCADRVYQKRSASLRMTNPTRFLRRSRRRDFSM